MYARTTTTGDDNSNLSYSTADFFGYFPPPDATVAPLIIPSLPLPPLPSLVVKGNEFDAMSALRSEVGYSSTSACSSYGSPSSLTSYGTSQSQRQSFIQRSVSSHSLQKNGFCSKPVLTPSTEFVDSDISPVRRVFSTGDLQERINALQHYHRSESPLSNENSSIIEGMTKACRYSPEEKKERIERYRSKRTQRNFNKKIKYACRKTLADSRPRIRGRFARNDEIHEMSSPNNQWNNNNHNSGEEDDEYDDDNWINLLHSFSSNLIP